MKLLVNFLIVLLLFSSNITAQWFQQNSGTTQQLEDISFIDSDNGLAVGYSTILRTTDGGSTWLLSSNYSMRGVTLLDAGIGFAVGWGGAIMKTTDGGINWSWQNSGTNYTLNGVSFIDSLTGMVVGRLIVGFSGYGIILKTTNGGTNWIAKFQGTGPLVDVSFIDDNNANVVGWGRVLRTTDGGENWISNSSFSGDGISFSDINNGTCVGWPAGSIYNTTDGGINWQPQNSGTNQWLLGVSSIDENNITVVGDGGTIVRTTNGGTNWNSQMSGTTAGLKAVHFTDINTGWVVGQSGTILKTTNGGLPVELINFTADIIDNDVILNWTTATETNNLGFEVEKKISNWQKIAFVKGHGTTTEPQFYSFIDESVAPGNYQYRLKQIDYDGSFEYSGIVEVEVGLPTEFSLEQNYPNPFNPSTKIKFTIPSVGTRDRVSVRLLVYDVLGNEIATLVNEEKPDGNYEVEFDGTGLPSGIYFYQLKVGSFIQTRKMVLMK